MTEMGTHSFFKMNIKRGVIRIWIVLTLCWVLGWAVGFLVDFNNFNKEGVTFPGDLWGIETEKQRSIKEALRREKNGTLNSEGKKFLNEQRKKDWFVEIKEKDRSLPAYIKRDGILGAFLMFLLGPLISWSILYIAIWILSGFKNGKA